MSRVSSEAKQTYAQNTRIYISEIDKMRQREKSILATVKEGTHTDYYKYISLSEFSLSLAAHYLLLNRISISLLGIKNEAFLKDARKCCSECMIYLEKIVGNQIDVAFSDLEDNWKQIEKLPDTKRYELMIKLGFTIDSVMDAFGENSKWRWSFVDLNGRFSIVFKNLIDFRKIVAGLDPRVKDSEVRHKMLALLKKCLTKSAEDFRLKYELSTNRIDDIKVAIRLFSALLRIHLVLGEKNEAIEIKKKVSLWKQKMEHDAKMRKTI